ncbi:putative acetyl-CoA acetyltransferase, cytosolic 2, partial [Camellia lanceoleosa]
MLAAQTIELGVNDNDIVVAGGMESMSNAPKYLAETRDGNCSYTKLIVRQSFFNSVHINRKGSRLGHDTIIDGMLKDRLWDVYNDFGMGVCADVCADKYTITREEQGAIQSFHCGIAFMSCYFLSYHLLCFIVSACLPRLALLVCCMGYLNGGREFCEITYSYFHHRVIKRKRPSFRTGQNGVST